jgi:FixJ family two-component response regulator
MALGLALSAPSSSGWHLAPNGALAPPLVAGAPPPHRESDARNARAVVHLVDIDESVRDWMSRLFASAGMETGSYPSLGAFMEADIADVPGCLVVHARLPLIGALQFLGRQAPALGMPIVVTTDRADVRTAVLAMKAGAIDFLEKPLCDHDVLEAVTAAIRVDCNRRSVDAHRAELRARFERLTPRERQVLALVTQGRLNKQVAFDLGLSEITVKVHRGSAMRKMGARTLAELVRMADAIADPA